MTEVVGFLVTNRGVQTGDFERDRAAAEAARDTITRALLINLTSAPLVSSSSGFLYRLNPQLGTMERATDSFGGFFVERALTPGHGRASFGVSGTTRGFDRLGDLELRDGSLITVANRFRDEPAPFDTEALTLRIRSTAVTVFGSVGIGDRLEVGAAFPLISLRLEGQRVNTYRGEATVQATGEGSARGIGDIALRAKYTIASSRTAAFAAAAETRLPTGDEENLLGAGSLGVRVMGIASVEQGRVAFHANGALAFGGVSDEVDVAAAITVAVRPRLTLSGEALFRQVNDLAAIRLAGAPHPSIGGVDTFRLAAADEGVLVADAVAGLKWNAGRAIVVSGHLSFPLVRRGLTAPVTPTVSFEYSF